MISTHTRFETPMSASTIESLIAKAKELGRSHIAYTDPGRVTGLFKVYKDAGKAGLKLIPGCELQIKTESCKWTKGLPFEYFTVTVFCHDQASYQKLGAVLSRPVGIRFTPGEDEVPYFSFKHLEVLRGSNVEINLHGLHSLIGKLLVSNRIAQANEALAAMREIAPVTFSVIAAKEDSTIREFIVVELSGHKVELAPNEQVDLDLIIEGKFKRIKIKAKELLESANKNISAIYPGGVKVTITPQKPTSVVSIKKEILNSGGCFNAEANKQMVNFALGLKIPLLISANEYMSVPEGRNVQDARLLGERLESDSLHMLTDDEASARLSKQGFTKEQISEWIQNTQKWAETFDFSLKYEWRLPKIVADEDQFVKELMEKTGRMKWDDPVWVERLNLELSVLRDNGVFNFIPYFIPIAQVFAEYEDAGRITGPGRGSIGASLLAYCMGFTHIDPIEYKLPFERFFSMDRVKTAQMPDVDVDLPNRDLLVETGGILERMVPGKYAQISTRGNLRLKSSILSVARDFNNGSVPSEIASFAKALKAAPQGVSDKDFVFGYEDKNTKVWQKGLVEIDEDLKKYSEEFPEQWKIVSYMLGISKSFGRHASAFVLLDDKIEKVVPTMTVNKVGPVTQYGPKEVEAAGLIKYDFLVLNQLLDFEVCLKLINKKTNHSDRAGYFMHQNKRMFIWDLPQNDAKVKEMLAAGDFSTIFQGHTQSMRPFMLAIQPSNVIDCGVVLSLVRPGPLDCIDPKTGLNMAEEYIERLHGRSEPDIPAMAEAIPETFGIIAYQESVNAIAKNIGKMSGERAEILRGHMCKKRKRELLEMKPEFMAGATVTVGLEVAEKIWSQMETFAQYGFSVIHAREYAMITYATMFLKAHYPLEWWTAVLTNADAKEIKEKLWKYVSGLVAPPDINLSNEEMVIDYTAGKIRNKLSVIKGLSENGVNKLVKGRPYRDLQHLVDSRNVGDAMLKKLMHVGVLDSLLSEPNANLIKKMTAVEDALNLRDYKEKLAEFPVKMQEYLSKTRKTKPKEPLMPGPALPEDKYLTMGLYEEISIKKELMPSVEVNITRAVELTSKRAKWRNGETVISGLKNPRATSVLVDGDQMMELDQENCPINGERFYYACAGIVVTKNEFTFAGGASKALKMVVDTDGYQREVVLWPDYNTKELIIPDGLEEGAIAVFFYSRNSVKPKAYLNEILIEYKPKIIAKKKAKK